MVDMNKLSRPALAAAMKGGTEEWGRSASATHNVRYSEPLERRPGRRRICHCGCGNRITHRGMANGLALVSACQLTIALWVKTGETRTQIEVRAFTLITLAEIIGKLMETQIAEMESARLRERIKKLESTLRAYSRDDRHRQIDEYRETIAQLELALMDAVFAGGHEGAAARLIDGGVSPQRADRIIELLTQKFS